MSMTFFEKELRKILEHNGYEFEWDYIGGDSAYLSRNGIQFKVWFIESWAKGRFDALAIKAMSGSGGKIDEKWMLFDNALGKLPLPKFNPNFPDGIAPEFEREHGEYIWRLAKPSEEHYELLAKQVNTFVHIFSDFTK